MKNTVQTDIDKSENSLQMQSSTSTPASRIEARFPSLWWGTPFLLAAFIQGIPLAGDLQAQTEHWAEAIYAATQANATTLGYENTIVPTLFWGALYLLSAGMVWNVLRTAILQRFWPFFLVIVVMMTSIFWSPYPAKVALNTIHNIGVFTIAYAAAYRYRQNPEMLLPQLGVVLGLNLALHTLAVFYIPAVAIQLDDRWCGLTTHPNSLGSLGFIALWANNAALGFTKKFRFRTHLGFCLLAVIVLAGTQSMTSVLCSLVAVGGTYLFKSYYQSSGNQIRSIKSGWLSLAFLGAAIITLLVLTTELPAWPALIGRSGDISGRYSIWLSAIALISNAPLLGYGFDSNAYANQISGMVHTTYHNGFLDLGVRGGLISLFSLILLLIRWYRQLDRITGLPISFITYFLPFILAVILYNMTEVTFFAARNILWISMLVIILTPEIPLSQQAKNYHRKAES